MSQKMRLEADVSIQLRPEDSDNLPHGKGRKYRTDSKSRYVTQSKIGHRRGGYNADSVEADFDL